jgi:dynein heavy chain
MIKFDYHVVDSNCEKPEDGVIIMGLFLEGCRWDYEAGVLEESHPKSLFSDAPYVWMKPTQERRKFKKYSCPVYKTSERKGVLSTTGHSTNFVGNIFLATDKDPDHWTKRGVALLTQLDD